MDIVACLCGHVLLGYVYYYKWFRPLYRRSSEEDLLVVKLVCVFLYPLILRIEVFRR